jgi:hypothetical protein
MGPTPGRRGPWPPRLATVVRSASTVIRLSTPWCTARIQLRFSEPGLSFTRLIALLGGTWKEGTVVEPDRTLLVLTEIQTELRRQGARMDSEFNDIRDRLQRLDERIGGFEFGGDLKAPKT